jgi:hypothetical protein
MNTKRMHIAVAEKTAVIVRVVHGWLIQRHQP